MWASFGRTRGIDGKHGNKQYHFASFCKIFLPKLFARYIFGLIQGIYFKIRATGPTKLFCKFEREIRHFFGKNHTKKAKKKHSKKRTISIIFAHFMQFENPGKLE